MMKLPQWSWKHKSISAFPLHKLNKETNKKNCIRNWMDTAWMKSSPSPWFFRLLSCFWSYMCYSFILLMKRTSSGNRLAHFSPRWRTERSAHVTRCCLRRPGRFHIRRWNTAINANWYVRSDEDTKMFHSLVHQRKKKIAESTFWNSIIAKFNPGYFDMGFFGYVAT